MTGVSVFGGEWRWRGAPGWVAGVRSPERKRHRRHGQHQSRYAGAIQCLLSFERIR